MMHIIFSFKVFEVLGRECCKKWNHDDAGPVLLFLIVHGSLSEKLVLHSTSPPDRKITVNGRIYIEKQEER